MLRLTEMNCNGTPDIKCHTCLGIGHLCDLEDCFREVTNRLFVIENILGDSYDLYHLGLLLQSDLENKKYIWPGDSVFVVDTSNKCITEQKVLTVHLSKDSEASFIITGYSVEERETSDTYRTKRRKLSQIGKTMFFSREAAEEKLLEMENKIKE